MRRFFLAALLMFFAGNASAFDACKPEGYSPILQRLQSGEAKSLFFKILKCNDSNSYILGTMHSDSAIVKNAIPASVFDIIEQSNSANFELKKDESMQIAIMSAMYYSPSSGQDLRGTIGDELYQKLQTLLAEKRKDLPEIVYKRMRPWAIGLLMSVPPDENDGVHLDASLEKFAISQQIPVYGLETVGEQLSVFTELSDGEQLEFLLESMNNFDVNQESNQKLLDLYLSYDLVGLQQLADQSFKLIKNLALKKKLETTLITNRNKVMLGRIESRIKEGKAFIAIGALHLPLEEGLLNSLEQKGYYIFPVN